MDQDTINRALEEARALVAGLEAYDGTVDQHHALMKQTDKIRSAMEGPYDAGTRWLESMSCAAAVNLLVRTDAFDKFPTEGSISAEALASACKVDASAITRAMRILVANGIFKETGKDEYAHTPLSPAFHPTILGGFVGVCADIMNAWLAIPAYFKSHEPTELYDTTKTPFAFAAGQEGKTYYEVLDLDPKQRDLWNRTLQNMASNFPILGMFPFEGLGEQVRNAPDRPFIVDVGGGRGQALLTIQKHVGGSFGGKLILEDLPSVIDTLTPDDIPGIEPRAYNIFNEQQPVKGMFLQAQGHRPPTRTNDIFL